MARVMIVDDTTLARRIMRNTLVSAGHEVVAEANSGETALDAYSTHKPDVVTMDVTMSGIDGIEASRRILAAHSDARVIMVTSLAREAIVQESLRSGVAAFVIKPFKPHQLLSAVDRVLV
jgi:two-component system, chemotaxis family, chemotaxis protein CheY